MNGGHATGRHPSHALRVALVASLIGAIALVGHHYLPLTLNSQQQGMPIPYVAAALDTNHYIAIAEGRISEVPTPFSKRVLFPWMAGEVSRGFHMPLALAFVELNFLAFILAGYCLAAILQKLKVNPWWAVLFLVTPMPLECLQRAYIPDLFHMALLALFFLLLTYEWETPALGVLLAAFLTRDNTLIFCMVLCCLAWLARRKFLFWGGIFVFCAGIFCESWFSRMGRPNPHHLPEFLYMFSLVPCDFLSNVLGIVVWTDASSYENVTPLAHWHIPPALQFGADREVYLAYTWLLSLHTFVYLATLFGCGPLVLRHLMKQAPATKKWIFPVQLAFYYGLISYVLGTSLGRTFASRMIGYGWPLFWIVLPYLFLQAGLKIRLEEKVFLISASLLTAWLPNLEGLDGLDQRVTFWLLGIPVLYMGTALCLDRVRNRREFVTDRKPQVGEAVA